MRGENIIVDTNHFGSTLEKIADDYWTLKLKELEESKPSFGPVVWTGQAGDWTVKVQKDKEWDAWTARWFYNGKEDKEKRYETYTKEDVINDTKFEIDRINKGEYIPTFSSDSVPKEKISVSSKKELTRLGYKSLGTGIYLDAKHHLWTLTREGNGYVIERNAEEETLRKAKECKTADKKAVSREDIDDFYFGGEISNKIQELVDKGMSWMDAVALLKEQGVIKTSSKVTIKSEVPIGQFLNDLSQSGVYYQKLSESNDDGKSTIMLDIDDTDKETFMNMAKDNNIVVEATKVAYQSDVFGMVYELYQDGEISDSELAEINKVYNMLEQKFHNNEINWEEFYRTFGDWIEDSFPRLKEKLGNKITSNNKYEKGDLVIYNGKKVVIKNISNDGMRIAIPDYAQNKPAGSIIWVPISEVTTELNPKDAKIEESQKVFSDEAVYSGIKHYMNMGFSKKEAIDNFIESFNLDKSYEARIKETIEKYKL